MGEFGQLLKTYRRQYRDPQNGQSLTQERLAERLSILSGVVGYSGSTVSNWERGLNQIRRDDRHVLVGLITILHQGGAIKTQYEANQFLQAGNYRPLNDHEARQVNPNWKRVSIESSDKSTFPTAAEQEAALPSPAYTQLFGIEEVSEQLRAQVLAPKSPYLLTIVALGGMGKTALADVVARQVIAQGEFDRVIWFSAENFDAETKELVSSLSIFQTMVTALYRLILPEGAPETSSAKQLAYVRSEMKRHRYLVILDNLENPVETNQVLYQLNTLTDPSKFLVTARQHPSPDTETYVFTLKELALPAAMALLRYRAETGGVTHFSPLSDEELFKIYQIVGGHPLALRLIPRLVRYYPLPEVLAGWQQEGQTRHIANMYQTIYESLWESLLPTERQLLQIMPFMAQAGATTHQIQFVSGLSRATFWPTLTKLVELCLIDPRGTWQEQRYGIHSLTERFLAYRQEGVEGTAVTLPGNSIVANIIYWRQTIQNLTDKQWSTLDNERANIFRAIQFSLNLPDNEISQSLKDDWIALSEHLFRYVERRGYVYEWLPILGSLSKKFVDDPKAHCLLLNRLGELYRLNHQFVKAIEIHAYVLRLAQEAEDELEVARSHHNLGANYFRTKEYELAIDNGQLALDIFSRGGFSGRETAATLNLLGLASHANNQIDSSIHYFEKAASIWRELRQFPELARTLNNLALVWQSQQKNEEAVACYAEAKRVLAHTDSDVDKTLICLSEGSLYYNLKQYAKAKRSFKQINLNDLRASGHLYYLALALNNLGNVAFMECLYAEAGTYLQESVFLWRELGNDFELANSLGRIGDVFVAQHELKTAESMYVEAETLLAAYPNDPRAVSLSEDIILELKRLRSHQKGG